MKFSEFPLNIPNLDKIKTKVTGITNEFVNAKDSKEAIKAAKKMTRYISDLQTDVTTINVRFTLNTQDETYSHANDVINETMPIVQMYINEYQKALINSPFRKELEDEFGAYLFKMIEVSLKTFDEKIIPELQEENRLTTEYDKLKSSAKIPFRGEVYNLPQMGKFLTSKDRDVRKEAFTKVTAFYEENDAEFGRIYDDLVKVRTRMAEKLGYENYVELGYLRLGRLDYDYHDVQKYRQQIYENVTPFVYKLFKKTVKRAGISRPKAYDYNQSFKDGDPLPKGDREALVNSAKQMYHEMSKETDEFFNFMLDNELMDLDARPGKNGGGYMTYFPRYKSPFIFANFNGTSADVDVLTHEMGHAFQGYLSRNIKIPEYQSPTLEACEIHSMSMEFFAWPWMNLFFDEPDKYRLAHLEGAIKFLPYGVAVDEFQENVYLNPNLTHTERKALWRSIEKKYLPHRKYDGFPYLEEGGFWIRQSHIYSTAFYYIDYTLAQVCAFQFAVERERNQQRAWNKYVRFCKLGGKYPFIELLEKGKLRNPFIEGNVMKVIRPLKRTLKTLEEKNRL